LRISSLKIKNFKNIPYLELGDLQNVVVIAGENGAGKSSTLRAIDFVKDVLYHRRREYQCKDGEIIRDQQKRMEIEAEFKPTTHSEKEIMKNKSEKARIVLERGKIRQFCAEALRKVVS
jgi:AAA15 family ATPase/GTPase